MSVHLVVGSFQMNFYGSICATVAWVSLLLGVSGYTTAANPVPVDFAQQIQPILVKNCINCHGPDKQRGGLRLDIRDKAFKSGDSGEIVIKPGDPNSGSLIKRLSTSDKSLRMPPKGDQLHEAEIALLRRWILEGARWPDSAKVPLPTRNSGPFTVTDTDRSHWAFRPLRLEQPKPVKEKDWCKTPIDRYVLAQIEAAGLKPNEVADRRRLIRRVYFDLLGLPPSSEEVAAFVSDQATDAYEKLIDRLLTNPHYGERWARHWLDLARYADSDGYEADWDRPTAYHYRDFVIKSFNDDLPYDRFVKWQLAGDEYQPNDPIARAATGFLAAGPVVMFTNPGEGTDLERSTNRYNELDDMLATTGSAFLGLTIGCARCHDHKFDPISIQDYYAMLAAFKTTKRVEQAQSSPASSSTHQQKTREWQNSLDLKQKSLTDWLNREKTSLANTIRGQKIAALSLSKEEKALLAAPADTVNQHQQDLLKKHSKYLQLTDEDFYKHFNADQRALWDNLKKEIHVSQQAKPKALPTALTVTDASAVPDKSVILLRGDPAHPGAEVQLGFLSVLSHGPVRVQRPEASITTHQRKALAEWITDTNSGAGSLLARVIVNRIWQHHFGHGLVRSPNDFGLQGETPSHPEMLDWLAIDFIQNGWRLKSLHRRIMTSAVYVQNSTYDQKNAKIDPDNRLLWRHDPLRMEAEVLRDSILAVSGKLNREMFGPSLKPPLPAEAMAGRNKDNSVPRPKVDGPALWRRSIYLFTKRSLPTPFLELFDAPAPVGSCGRRNQSTVATQALTLLNDTFLRNQAVHFAHRVVTEAGDDNSARINRAFELTLSRPPTTTEMERGKTFLNVQDREKAFVNFCHVLLTLNEFIYVD